MDATGVVKTFVCVSEKVTLQTQNEPFLSFASEFA